MSNFAPPPQKPDGRIFASYPMPAKIDLLQERPRRESLVEQQLGGFIGQQQQANNLPTIQVTQQVEATSNMITNRSMSPQFSHDQQQPIQSFDQSTAASSPTPVRGIKTSNMVFNETINSMLSNKAADRAAELAEKEAKLMAEIDALSQRPYSPFQTPAKIDLTNEQRASLQQTQHAPSPRPSSRASSTRATSADLMDKEAKLLQEIEEIEKKPFNPQTMVIEREQWYEYPGNRPNDRHLTESKRRIKDFCSLPSNMYDNQNRHIHEENLPHSSLGRRQSPSPSSIHTTIIRSPRREVDNKAPLPFAFDNFTTKGVRGNIASVGAIEPDRPRPPIYPIVRRSPSPHVAM